MLSDRAWDRIFAAFMAVGCLILCYLAALAYRLLPGDVAWWEIETVTPDGRSSAECL